MFYKSIEELGLIINNKDRKPIVKTKEEKKLFEQLLNKSFFLPNKNSNPVPIKKIRIKKNFSNAEPLKENMNQWVDLGKNHHVLIYMDSKGALKEDVITFWTAVERKRIGDSVYKIPLDGKGIIEILQINDMFLLGYKENEIDWNNLCYDLLKDNLYKAQSLSTGYYNFKKHIDSRPDKDSKKNYITIRNFGKGKTGWNTFNPIKVKVNSIGKIEKV